MNRSELIFSLICENDETFQNISKEDTAKLLVTSKIVHSNINVTAMAAKYKAQDLFSKLNRNIISLAFARLKKNEESVIECFSKEQRLIDILFNSDVKVVQNFLMKYISEYKQQMYDSIYNTYYFEDIEQAIFEEHQRIVEAYGLYEDVYYHQHDPTHCMFEKNEYFEFYDNVEKYGNYILDEWMRNNWGDTEDIDDEDF